MINKSERDNRIKELAESVLSYSRNEILLSLRFMDTALYKLEYETSDKVNLAVDGRKIYYDPRYVFDLYKMGNSVINRAYLHSILHCVLLHPFGVKGLNEDVWNLSCDIAVEGIISELNNKHFEDENQTEFDFIANSLKQTVGRLTAEKLYKHFLKDPDSLESCQSIAGKIKRDDHAIWYTEHARKKSEKDDTQADSNKTDGVSQSGSSQTPQSVQQPESQNKQQQQGQVANQSTQNGQQVFGKVAQQTSGQTVQSASSQGSQPGSTQVTPGSTMQNNQNDKNGLIQAGYLQNSTDVQTDLVDDDMETDWHEISEKIKVDMETISKKWGDTAGNLIQNLKEVNRERYDYSDFLRKFSTLGEEMKINDDEFDYIFYTYGIDLYGNMPLIEPLEYKEVKKIKEFIIAIDTSGSVFGEKVEAFLNKTYNILMERESFFTKVNVHIIQCDASIQEVAVIKNRDDFTHYINSMSFKGFGGTDFRPVFQYAQEKIKDGTFTNLKGLIYFTDGYGTFPEKKPDFDAAFVFVDDEYNVPQVPVWAIKLVLGTDEI